MFEIQDDDGFWEKLPLDDGFEGQTNHPDSLASPKDGNVNGFLSGPNHFTSGFSKMKVPPADLPPPLAPEPRNDNGISADNGMMETDRPQLAQIHNVITCNRVMDQTSMASTSTSAPQSDFPYNSNQLLQADPLQGPVFNSHSFADQTPSRNRSSHNKPGSKRKFPGPAGILPESFPSDSCNIQPNSPVIVKDPTSSKLLPSSQSSLSCDPFSSVPWLSLISDVGPDAKSVLDKFAIRSMLLKASKRVLPKGKIPLVLAHVESVDFHGCDGTAVLRDPSGKVNGALHNDLVKDLSTAIKSGCVIVLRQTSVISPTPRTHYLNITPANIVVIYSQTKDSPSTVQKSPWSPVAAISSTSSPSSTSPTLLPSLSQVIQDSDNELTSAINNPPQQQITPTTTSRQMRGTPNNMSQMSLFGSVTSYSPSPLPHHRYPATTASAPINNRFKSPTPSHATTTTPSTRPPFSYQRYPSNQTNTNNSSTNSIQTNPYSPQTQFSSAHSHALGANNNNKPHSSSKSFPNQPSTTNRQPFSSSIHTNQQHLASTSKMQPPAIPNKTSGQTSSVQQDDFLDDDSDLLSLCDNSDSMSNQNISGSANVISHCNKNSAEIYSTHSHNSFSFSNTNNSQNNKIDSRNYENLSSISNKFETFLGKSEGITSAAQRNFSEAGKTFTSPSLQLGKFGTNFKNTTRSDLQQTRSTGHHDLTGNADVGASGGINRNGSGGGRDARVQLGVSKPPPPLPQQAVAVPVAQAPSFGTWDDDLDDDLLSQL